MTPVASPVPQVLAPAYNPTHDLLALVPALIWPLALLILVLAFRETIAQLTQLIMNRVRDGGAVKLWQFELGQTYVSSGGVTQNANAIHERDDVDRSRRHERAELAMASRRVYIVHRLQTSRDPTQLYDIVLYAIPAKEGTLASVRHIEYFFGRSWGHRIFTSDDRAKGFPVTLSAWGPFLCTAKIVFTDDESYTMYRFIDFEMGPVGAASGERNASPTERPVPGVPPPRSQ